MSLISILPKPVLLFVTSVCLIASSSGPPLAADMVALSSSKDNTLFEDPTGALSNGAGSFIYSGQNSFGGGMLNRRGLVSFDVMGMVPAGSTINSVQLVMNLSQTQINTATVSLHRVTQDWGEGTSNSDGMMGGGAGAPASGGDATWIHTFSPGSTWTNVGGDYNPAASASLAVGPALGLYTWGSNAGLVSDVQDWLDNPTSNFGWMILGDESTQGTAKRFDSRENVGGLGPQLLIDFTPIPEPSSTAIILLGGLATGVFRGRRRG